MRSSLACPLKMVFWHFCPLSLLLKCIIKLVSAVLFCAPHPCEWQLVSSWYLCLLKLIILLRVLWMALVSMGLCLSLAGESQHQINCMGTTNWKATGRENRTESQAIGTKMLRWDIYQDSLAHITSGRSEGEWKKQKLGGKDICLLFLSLFAFSKQRQVLK